jgi:hypothetical protein
VEETYAKCDWCDKPISYGNVAVTINKNIEQIDRTAEDPDGIVTVIQSDVITTLCGNCGNRLHIAPLRNMLSLPINKRRQAAMKRSNIRAGKEGDINKIKKKKKQNNRRNRFEWRKGDVEIIKPKKRKKKK